MGCRFSTAVSPEDSQEDEAIAKSHFSIERCIGQGGFGKVHAVIKNRGHDKGTWYAMKSLNKRVILERNHTAMVMKERNLLSRLHCPQLVNMHYAFQDAKFLYICMDVCLGGDLHYQLSHSPSRCFSEEQAKFYCASILLCLDYMHSVGVLHRDIKPENLLLDTRGQLKVTDLGISMELGPDGVCTSTSGTRPYMAPEIFMAGHRHGTTSDFYALGITTYQFLLGQRPYKPDTNNMKALVRMATFVPPEKYTEVRQIRRILIAAQERKAPSPEFRYSQRLAKFSSEARDFVTSCLICNPKYRLGSQGIHELLEHPWFSGVDWEAMRRQEIPALFLPDIRQPNCNISDGEAAAIMLNEEQEENKDGANGSSTGNPQDAPIPPTEQAKFNGFDYRTRVKDNISGRSERIIRHGTSLAQAHYLQLQQQQVLLAQQQQQQAALFAANGNGGGAVGGAGSPIGANGAAANSLYYPGNDRERVKTINPTAGGAGGSMVASGHIVVGSTMLLVSSASVGGGGDMQQQQPQQLTPAGAFSVTPPTQQQQQTGAMPRRSSGGINSVSSRNAAAAAGAGGPPAVLLAINEDSQAQQQQQQQLASLLPPSSPAMRANAMPTIAVSPSAGGGYVTTNASPLKSIPVSPPASSSSLSGANGGGGGGGPTAGMAAASPPGTGQGQRVAYPAFIFPGDGNSGGNGGANGGEMLVPPMLPPPSDNPAMQLLHGQQSLFPLNNNNGNNGVGGAGGGDGGGGGGGGYSSTSRRMLVGSNNNNNNKNNNGGGGVLELLGEGGAREASSGAPSSVGTTGYQQSELANPSNSGGGRARDNNPLPNRSQAQQQGQQPQYASILGSPVRQSPTASFSSTALPGAGVDGASGSSGASGAAGAGATHNPRSTLAAVAGVGLMAVNIGIPAALPAAQAGKWLAAATAGGGGSASGNGGGAGGGMLRSASTSPVRGAMRPTALQQQQLPPFEDLPGQQQQQQAQGGGGGLLLRPGSVEDEFIDGPPPPGYLMQQQLQ